jgi:hypothetical protein
MMMMIYRKELIEKKSGDQGTNPISTELLSARIEYNTNPPY